MSVWEPFFEKVFLIALKESEDTPFCLMQSEPITDSRNCSDCYHICAIFQIWHPKVIKLIGIMYSACTNLSIKQDN